MKKDTKASGFWSGAAVGTLTGIGSLLAYQYFSGIFRQPRLISQTIFSNEEETKNREALAMFIAMENLRSGIRARWLQGGQTKEIVHAGYRNFRESWARDFGFATFGLLALGQFDTVKDTLDAFFWHQKQGGQLPVKLYSMHVVTRFFYSLFGREQPTEVELKPKYISGHGAPSLDGQAMLVIAALEYAQQAEDTAFLLKYWEQLELAMKWLQIHRKETDSFLLTQGAYADWADSLSRRGHVLYTNVIYWKVLSEMAQAAISLDLTDEAAHYSAEAEGVSRAIHDEFWQADLGYFVTTAQLKQLGSAGNLLAIAWGLASAEEAESILKFMEEAKMSEPIPTRVSQPPYPSELVALENHLGSLANYHTTASWLWIGAWHAIALMKSGHLDKAQNLLERISEIIIRDGQVNEAYGLDGKPLSSFWYKSEAPLIWNAGMVVYAYHVFEEETHPKVDVLSAFESIVE